MEPRFSVVIPTYNRGGLIGATIESVLRQTCTDYEIIVIDDGSTDDTTEVLSRYGERIKIIRQSNQGEGPARNAGMRLAMGTYIAFLDSDDLWFPWTLSVFASAIISNGYPSIVMGQPIEFINDQDLADGKVGKTEIEVYKDYYHAASVTGFWCGMGGAVIKKEVLAATDGFKTLVVGSDTDLLFGLGMAAGFCLIRTPATFAYRQHSGSVRRANRNSFIWLIQIVEREHRGKHPGGYARAAERQRIICRLARSHSLSALRQAQFRPALALFGLTLAWQIRRGRVRYLFAFPMVAVVQLLRNLYPRK